ncbi:hypothetical protein DFH11DRAFT_449066 [Phellopilus nigrolimitatus]|nr:hypothetical protein DFH11DRAFT_449066 [Phellopilus nigrolimitatus]
MSNSPAPAHPVLISSLSPLLMDQKIRIAGKSLSYEHGTQLLLVQDETNHACLVDTTLVLEAMLRLPDLRESKMTVSVIGYLDRVKQQLAIPIIPAFVDVPEIDPSFVVRAILLTPSPDLDLTVWKESIRQRENAGVKTLLIDA